MSGTILTWDKIREKYPEDKFLFVMPAVEMTVTHSHPMWRLDVAIVNINPLDKFLVYAVDGAWDLAKSEKVALQKPALDLLAAAAEISVKPVTTSIQQAPHKIIRVDATAIMNTPSGAVRGQIRSREWDGELEYEKVVMACESFADRAVANQDPWARGWTAETRAAMLATRVKKEWLREREFGPVKTESKACGRAIRAALALDSAYDPKELKAKSFVIPRWVFEPDMDDPQIRMLTVQAGMAAQRQLGGGFDPAPPVVQALPPAFADAEVVEDDPAALRQAAPTSTGTIETGEGRTVDTATGEALPPEPRDLPEDIGTLSIELSKAIMAFVPADGSDVTKEKLTRRWDRAVKKQDHEDMRATLAWLWNREGGTK